MPTGIRCYHGLFSYSPHALHMDGPPCAYNCAYCFTRGKRHRMGVLDEKSVAYWRRHLATRTGFAGWFLERKKIVLASNAFDIFSGVHSTVRPLMEACVEEKIPLAYQTKGGREALAWAKVCPKANWYVTITSDNAAIGRVESAAPPQVERMRLCEALVGLGHTVSIGINPAVPSWWTNLPGFLRWAEGTGVCGIVAYGMHLNNDHTDESLDRLGTAIVRAGRQRVLHDVTPFCQTALPVCRWSTTPWDFWDASDRVYAESSLLPTAVHFWKSRIVNESDGWYAKDATLEDWISFWKPSLPQGVSPFEMQHYCGSWMGRNPKFREKFELLNTFADLLTMQWNSAESFMQVNIHSEIIGKDGRGNAIRRYKSVLKEA